MHGQTIVFVNVHLQGEDYSFVNSCYYYYSPSFFQNGLEPKRENTNIFLFFVAQSLVLVDGN